MAQEMVRGWHNLQLICGYRSLFRRRYVESWVCPGCGIMLTVKGREASRVNLVVRWLRGYHSGFISDEIIQLQMLNTDGAGLNTLIDETGEAAGVTVRLDWTLWKLKRKGVDWR